MFFVDVILPIPLKQSFTYSVNKDEALFLKPGMRVAVPFGRSKIYTGVVHKVHRQTPVGYDTKSIDHILDESPVLTPQQLKHWEWIASYYMCSQGEVIKAGLPGTFLLESETIVKRIDSEVLPDTLTEEEYLIYEALQYHSGLHIQSVREILDRKNVVPVVQKLVEKGLVVIEETIYESYTPRLKKYVRLAPDYDSQDRLQHLLEELSRAPKQREVILNYFSLKSKTKKPVEAKVLQKKSDASASVFKALTDKGILEEYFIRRDRISHDTGEQIAVKSLNTWQETAYREIKTFFSEKDVVLLHGVTSSGKTEIYVRLIEEAIQEGRQILYLVPEIALTTQLISRLQKYFGEFISVYHSRYSLNERTEVWNNVLHNKSRARLVVGARSAVFLPFSNLGLVIIDEEHESSFKQYSPAPRYHGRDSAVVLASLHRAKVLMGSATPSLESYYNARTGKYGLVTLKKRYGNILMPEIELVDIREKSRKKQMKGRFSNRLLEGIRETLDMGEQVILFQNRRGYSPVVECTTCGVSPQCPNCDVTLTYHQKMKQLRCHYCGYHTPMIRQCVACGSQALDTKGFGTEQIELEIKKLFPEYAVARMDQDTTRGKHAYSRLLDALENQEIDILVGTQMLAKGLDFRNIGLVGVMNADNLLHFPDFRAHERSFQLLQQVAGRSGRSEKRGRVLIQTYNPLHPILKQVCTHDYEAMYNEQLKERREFKYPPFYRILKVEFRDRNLSKVQEASAWFGQALRNKFGDLVLGPVAPPVARVRNQFIFHVLLKIPENQSLTAIKKYVGKVERSFDSVRVFSSVRLHMDVDPY